jgi:hypothetical protein
MITYKQLKTRRGGHWVDSDEWGIQITQDDPMAEDLEQGDEVEVIDDDGTIRRETVGRILSRRDGFIICSIDKGEFDEPIYSELNFREGRCRDPFPLS